RDERLRSTYHLLLCIKYKNNYSHVAERGDGGIRECRLDTRRAHRAGAHCIRDPRHNAWVATLRIPPHLERVDGEKGREGCAFPRSDTRNVDRHGGAGREINGALHFLEENPARVVERNA